MEGDDESFTMHPATSPIRPLDPELRPCALWVVKSQNSSGPCFTLGDLSFYCLTAHTHRAHSAALFTPCLPLRPPLALFMKACPLSAALSAPSRCGADYPHPESTSFPIFFMFVPLYTSPCTLTPHGILAPLSCAPSSSSSLFPHHDILLSIS